MKHVFITGAGAGIGLAAAQLFAERGWFVGIYDINTEAVEAHLQSGEFPNACGGYCDVTDPESIESALAEFGDRTGGRLDVLVNNAGVLFGGAFEEIPPGQTHAMIDINIKGLTDVAYIAFPMLRDTPNSSLVNVGSMSNVYGVPRLAVYSASKFYLRGLTEALNVEWDRHDIHVTSVRPPFVKTAMLDNIESKMKDDTPPEFGPEDVAAAIYDAAHDRRVSHLMGRGSKVMNLMFRLAPESVARRLMLKSVDE